MAADKVSGLDEDLAEKITLAKLDVSSRASVAAFFGQLKATVGSLYGLVNCFHFKGNTRKLDTMNFFADFENYPKEK